jgi:hypothetical protein
MEIKPEWLSVENVPRVSASDLPLTDFIAKYEQTNMPVIITDLVSTWPAFKKWSREALIESYGSIPFIAGPLNIDFRDYMMYAERTEEETPFYIFDKKFAEKAPQLAADYPVPEYFSEDLFRLLGMCSASTFLC